MRIDDSGGRSQPGKACMKDKIVSADEAVAVIRDGDTLANTGFIGSGAPEELLAALARRFLDSGRSRGLTVVFAAGHREQGRRPDRAPPAPRLSYATPAAMSSSGFLFAAQPAAEQPADFTDHAAHVRILANQRAAPPAVTPATSISRVRPDRCQGER